MIFLNPNSLDLQMAQNLWSTMIAFIQIYTIVSWGLFY